MRIVLIHQNFPGQLRHLAVELVRKKIEFLAIGGPSAQTNPLFPTVKYNINQKDVVTNIHPSIADFQSKVIRAQAVGKILENLKGRNWIPDLIIGHSGWGELLSTKDIFPNTPVIHFMEYFYHVTGLDVGFDSEFNSDHWEDAFRVRLKRSTQLLSLQDLDAVIMPTHFQANTLPAEFKHKARVIHEGIDTESIAPRSGSCITLKRAGVRFVPGDELVTFASRSLEPLRGFHMFMRCLPALQKLRPNAHVIIVGAEDISYGTRPQNSKSWKEKFTNEVCDKVDMNRIHFVGRVEHNTLHDLFRVCACHVYLTYPFVLSWSMLEAMSCGAVVIGSKTAPVEEVIEHQKNGLLVDFFDYNEIAHTISRVLSDYQSSRQLGINARKTIVDNYDLNTICLPKMLNIIETVSGITLPHPITTSQKQRNS